jgi:hypothetical protein
LSPCGFGQHGADDLVAFEGDFFAHLFVHGFFLLCGGFGSSELDDRHHRAQDKPMERSTVSKALYSCPQNHLSRRAEKGWSKHRGD